jgi:hypothetical protein
MAPPPATSAEEIRHRARAGGIDQRQQAHQPRQREVQRDPVGPPLLERNLAPLGMAGLDNDDPQAKQRKAHRRESE